MAIEFTVRTVRNTKDTWHWISSRHYSRGCPRNSNHIFGLFDGDKMIGLCMFGPPSRLQAGRYYAGCIELTRLFVEDGTPKNTESFFVGSCLRTLKKESTWKGVISYADPNVGHSGVVYQASNFRLIGQSSRSYHYLAADGTRTHSKQVRDRAETNEVKEKTQARREGLRKVFDLPKFIYFYPLKRGASIGNESGAKRANLAVERSRFFEAWTRELAWVVGLIYGDGSVHTGSKTYRILFFGNEDTVDKFRPLLRVDRKKKKSNGFETYFDSKTTVQWFRDRGVQTKKSHTLVWPPDLPDQLKWDFIRGLVDTDGTFAFDDPSIRGARGREKLNLGFSSATKTFCERFAVEIGFPDAGIYETRKVWQRKTYLCYSMRLGFEDSLLVLRKVYDCPEHIRNEERYQKYLRAEALWAEYHKGCQHRGPRGGLCGKPIQTGEVCMEHMWSEKLDGRVCEGCGAVGKEMTGWFCTACKYRSWRLMKNPNLKPRRRR